MYSLQKSQNFGYFICNQSGQISILCRRHHQDDGSTLGLTLTFFLFFHFQNLKNQIMTTNLWVEQVSPSIDPNDYFIVWCWW